MTDFSRTLETAKAADATAKLLDRAAERAWRENCRRDKDGLEHLAERYRDYAAALRETVADAPAEPEPDQGVLL